MRLKNLPQVSALADAKARIFCDMQQTARPFSSFGASSNALRPDLMTPAERLDEIAEILAAAIMRLRLRQNENVSSHLEKFRLDLSPTRSGHGRPSGRRERRA
jgi:hypothetical protein